MSDSDSIHPLFDRLRRGPILADGGMGTMLYRRGVPFDRCFDELNLSDPKLVQRIHQDYLHAGAQLIETNTFGGNRIRLSSHGLESRVRDINLHGVKVAREAREIEGTDALVAGAIGPLGKSLAPLGSVTPAEARALFAEQAAALLEGGVDLFIIETMSDQTEMAEAIAAVRSVSRLPIIALMTFTDEGVTLAGIGPEETGRFLESTDADVIGANCSVGPQGMLEWIYRFARVVHKPVTAIPNAGMPRLVDGRFVYSASPEYFASVASAFLANGAQIIGGCCGTTPDHIAAMAAVLRSAPPVSSAPTVTLGKMFQISAELDPPKGTNPAKLLEGARLCRRQGVNAVNIADSPMARVRMSAMAVAALIERDIGIETVLHFTCRDRNLMGIQSDLIGAHALGIRNILAITGDPPSVGDYPHATGVYDIDAIGLTRVVAGLNAGKDYAGASIGRATNFAIGVALNPTALDWAKEEERFRRKVEAGAHFAFTQPLYDLDPLWRCLEAIARIRIPVFLGILPLMSYRHALYLNNEVPGISVPTAILQRMEKAGDKGAEVGIEAARNLLERARASVQGTYLMPSFGRYETCLRVIEGMIPASDHPVSVPASQHLEVRL
ncbi:MAG: bifunctional homocysteine S-methyltransferase/methylenetetrahydrofolate reductase [candidate division Zixibacteria bacterium]|nr:bifunctional homocysteine S-methyltransferase/methylenetetrahydrofolate reductase [candidate division Zixibacteria bacterium]